MRKVELPKAITVCSSRFKFCRFNASAVHWWTISDCLSKWWFGEIDWQKTVMERSVTKQSLLVQPTPNLQGHNNTRSNNAKIVYVTMSFYLNLCAFKFQFVCQLNHFFFSPEFIIDLHKSLRVMMNNNKQKMWSSQADFKLNTILL